VTAVWSNPNHLDLFISGADGTVKSTFWEANPPPPFKKGWQDWFDIFPDSLSLRNAANVTTELYDRSRTGAYLNETILTPAVVQSARFGKRVQWQVEGQILAQPLYMRDVPVGGGRKNLVFAATAANLLYAFDADSVDATASPVYQVRLGAADELVPPHHTIVSVSDCKETVPSFIGMTALRWSMMPPASCTLSTTTLPMTTTCSMRWICIMV
jgi:hypothetical protein